MNLALNLWINLGGCIAILAILSLLVHECGITSIYLGLSFLAIIFHSFCCTSLTFLLLNLLLSIFISEVIANGIGSSIFWIVHWEGIEIKLVLYIDLTSIVCNTAVLIYQL